MSSPATPLSELVASISIEKTRIQRFPSSLAVFGGSISKTKTAKNPKSCRDQFVKHIRTTHHALEKHIFVPENYDDWNDDAVYRDLLKFEEDLGHLTSAVLIFLEAPGAIAELGAFSQILSLRDRLVVVVKADHYKNKSFIKLGPLKQLENINPDCICVMPFTKKGMVETDLSQVVSQVDNAIKKHRPSQSFDKNNQQHRLLLTLDLITLSEISCFEDLIAARESFGISREGGTVSLRQALFTLEKANLIATENYKNQTFYLPNTDLSQQWLEYTTNSNKNFIRERWQAQFRKFISRNAPLKRAWEIHHKKELVA